MKAAADCRKASERRFARASDANYGAIATVFFFAFSAAILASRRIALDICLVL